MDIRNSLNLFKIIASEKIENKNVPFGKSTTFDAKSYSPLLLTNYLLKNSAMDSILKLIMDKFDIARNDRIFFFKGN